MRISPIHASCPWVSGGGVSGPSLGDREVNAIVALAVGTSLARVFGLTDGDQKLRARLRELANERRRFGYRRLLILLEREGWAVNHKKVYRLYREEGLAVRRRRGRKRALGTRRPIIVPDRVNRRPSQACHACPAGQGEP